MKIDRSRFVGGHPLAGRERSGAAAARGDLFEGRPWVLTPSEDTGDLALARATELVRLCGAQLVVMSPARHDQAVALISHVPQVLATLAAARLADADADLVTLSGQGVRDVTRIAASDTGLWTEILSANARCVLPVLDEVAADLDAVRAALRIINSSVPRQVAESINVHGHAVREGSQAPDDDAATGVLADLLRKGNEGYRRIPGKHGTAPATYVGVPVVVPDRPGELARLLVACGEAQVNVEDVSIEHSLGQPVGLVEVAVRPAAAQGLADALRERGWSVHF
jgi:prephenate dehydrogenase